MTKASSLPDDAIFTVGHSNRSQEEFLALLKAYGIRRLVDIRTIPRSRHNPQFNDTALAKDLPKAHIEYAAMKSLGGLRHAHKNSPNTGWHNESFRGYADYMQTEEFKAALEKLISVHDGTRMAIMCAEAVPWRCHRSLVADALMVRGIRVVDILSETNWRPHELTSFAHVDGTEITYPPEQKSLFQA
jgi:uncharacterized protein (DUF488 family)